MARHILIALLLSTACTTRRHAQPDDLAGWARVVAALQQAGEEYTEALELDDAAKKEARKAQLSAFLGETAALARKLAASSEDERVAAGIESLQKRVLGTDYELNTTARELVAAVLRKPIARTPPRLPDLARGKALFAQACAACHGANGTGGAPLAATMDPPPPDILHPQYNWTPFEMVNRVTYGGIETAMPSFAEGLSPADRWDIVFWLFAERWPPCTKELPPLGADELAQLGDFELGNKFGYGAASCLRRNFR